MYTLRAYATLWAVLTLSATVSAQEVRALRVESEDVAMKGGRVALVIGNADYQSAPLKNPVNDASDFAAALEQCGFDVTLETNATRRQMLNAIQDFGLKIPGAEAALFYFAGHGMQVENVNWLVPVDAEPTAEHEVRFECVEAARIMAKMEHAGAKSNVMILDACRNNPFPRQFRSSNVGLATMGAKGLIVSFAAAPGTVAEDGDGRNGMFTKHLLARMMEPGIEIERVLKNTRQDVSVATQDRQWPQTNSLLVGDFYFVPPDADAPVDARPVAPVVEPDANPEPLRSDAASGDANAQNALGIKLLAGEGMPRDTTEAMAWFRKAADQGHPDAQNNLGVMYFKGWGAARNDDEAFRWFQRAARQGHSRAGYNLGVMYDLGRGTNADSVEAYAWYWLAAHSGDEEADRAVTLLAERLTETESTAADERAQALLRDPRN